jgi:hypothetical protein
VAYCSTAPAKLPLGTHAFDSTSGRNEGLVRPAPVTHLIETDGGSLFLTTAPDRRAAAKAKKKVRSIAQFTAKVRCGGSEPRCAVSLVCSRGSMRDVQEKIPSDDHRDRLVDGWE